MSRVPPDLLHIMNGDRELCHARNPETVLWLHRELDVAIRVEPEWRRKMRRISLLFKRPDEFRIPPPPLDLMLQARRSDGRRQGDYLQSVTERETAHR